MELVLRGKQDREFLKFLLDKAQEEGFGVNAVRLLPDGLYLPLDLADSAGLLDHIKTPPPEVTNDQPESATPASTGRKPRKSAAKKAEGKEVLFTEEPIEDPWL